jgi:hypothetical protein
MSTSKILLDVYYQGGKKKMLFDKKESVNDAIEMILKKLKRVSLVEHFFFFLKKFVFVFFFLSFYFPRIDF